MKKSAYLPSTIDGQGNWLDHFAGRVPDHNGLLNLDDVTQDGLAADNAYAQFAIKAAKDAQTHAAAWVAYRNDVLTGKGPTLGDRPVVPVLGTPPPIVAPGVLNRATTLAGRIKKTNGYTDSLGEDLRIIGADQTQDLDNLKPILTAKIVAGQIIIGWKKQGMQGIEILVDRGNGFTFLTIDTVPDYTDTQTPAAGQAAVWKYKAIYRLNDERVGQWSDVLSVTVAG